MWNFVVLLYQEATVETERHFWCGIHMEDFLQLNLQGAVERYQRNPMGVLENCIGKFPGLELEREIKRQSEQKNRKLYFKRPHIYWIFVVFVFFFQASLFLKFCFVHLLSPSCLFYFIFNCVETTLLPIKSTDDPLF